MIGLSIRSGSHRELLPTSWTRCRGGGRNPGHRRRDHPDADVAPLRDAGVAAIYTAEGLLAFGIMRDMWI